MRGAHRVAVKTMVARVLRSGDLRIEFSDSRRSRDGIRIHRRIQKRRPANYEAEVPVSIAVETAKTDLKVSGRIDGVYRDTAAGCTVEEIKTTLHDLEQISRDPDPVHLGQAHCYAYMYAVEKNLASIAVHLTYCQVESGRTATWAQTYSVPELARRFHAIVDRYLARIERYLDWQVCRNDSIQALAFPFDDYRDGQRDMAVGVYRAIRDRRQLLVQAATGIGKTLAALFPAIKATVGIENPVILYLTARTTGRLAADKAIGVMREKGLRLKTLTITAKDKICFLAERSCNPEDCEFARGYFDRVDAALESVFAADDFSRSRIEAVAREFGICPFEFSLELIFYSDCLICDYNYAFDPRVSLKRLVVESDRNCIYLVDEAHNLVDRSREMFSAQIEKQAVLDLRRKVCKKLPALFKRLGKINSWMVVARKQCRQLPGGAFSQNQAPLDLLTRLTAFVRQAETWLVDNLETPFREDLLAFYFRCVNFLKTADQYGDEYVTFVEQSGDDLRVKLFCLDPAKRVKAAQDNSAAAIYFSATMTPADYFRRLFGCPADTAALQIGSPFPGANLGIFVADRVSTLYRQRDATLAQVGEILQAVVAQKSGNYLFFFPSYRYLEMVQAAVVQAQPALSIIVQTPEMSHSEKKAFLRHFQERRDHTLVGFAVLGGIFGEGIDLVGDKLCGAAVVGVGLPAISYENELIKAYFNAAENAGFQYAYQYPGINRVLQGAGRVIRTAQDRGIVLLVDQRYGRHSYRTMLPKEWRPVRIRGPEHLEAALDDFWRNRGVPS